MESTKAAAATAVPIKVTALQSWTIRPAEPTPDHFLFLSCFDLRLWHYPHIRRLLFYPAPTDYQSEDAAAAGALRFAKVVERLKTSLAKALVHYFPLAGRLTELEVDDGREGGGSGAGSSRPSLECNDAGVEFVAAEAHATFAQLGPDFQPAGGRFGGLVAEPDEAGDHREFHKLPLLCVQVTKFECGGVALGLAFNHVVTDGPAFWQFVKRWAQISRDELLFPHPVHDRRLLHPPSSPELNKLCSGDSDLSTFSKYFRLLSATEVKNGASMVPKSRMKLTPPTTELFFCFSSENLVCLKRDALAGVRNGQLGLKPPQWFSSHEVLSALLWRCINRARGLGRKDEQVTIYVPVGCRNRLPFLPDTYFGNAAHTLIARASAHELLTNPLGFAAGLIRQTTTQCTKEVIAEFIGTSEAHSVFTHARSFPNVCAATGSNKLACLECDFGWGKPVCVRQVTDNLPGIMVYNPGQLGPGSIDVSLRLFPHQMEAFVKDPELLRYWTKAQDQD